MNITLNTVKKIIQENEGEKADYLEYIGFYKILNAYIEKNPKDENVIEEFLNDYNIPNPWNQ